MSGKIRRVLEDDAYIAGDADYKLQVRVGAATLVLRWNPKDQDAAELLLKAATSPVSRDFRGPLGGRWPDVRAVAIRGLSQAGKEASQWVDTVRKILKREILKDRSLGTGVRRRLVSGPAPAGR